MTEATRSPDGSSTLGGVAPEALLDVLVEGVLVLDEAWRFTYLNAPAARLLGRGREELLGRVLWEVYPELPGSPFSEAYRRVRAEGVPVTLKDFNTRLGVWLEVHMVPRDGCLVVLFRDVSARHEAERAREKSATRLALLQGVTAELSAAASVEAVVGVIIRSAKVAVGADGGAVGLLEPDGRTLRLVCHEGLSPESVQRYTLVPPEADVPFTRVLRSGASEWLESPAEVLAHYPHLKPEVRVDPGRAFACLPLRAKDAMLGALSFSFGGPRAFDAEDREFMVALTHQAALALDRARLFAREQAARAEAESERARLRALVMNAPLAVGLMRGREHRIELDNPRHRELHGGRNYIGLPVREAVPEAQAVFEVLDRVYDRGESIVDREHPVEDRFYDFSFEPLRDASGRVDGVAFFGYDVSNQVRARRALEALAQQLRLLAEVGMLMTGALDASAMLEGLARLVVPGLADWCAVDMLTEDGRVESVAVAHQDPAQVERMREVLRAQPISLSAPHGAGKVLRTGEPEWVSDVPDTLFGQFVRTPGALPLLRALGMRSYLCVPLVARGRTLGVLSLIRCETGSRYTEADLRLAEELARRAALGLDNARLYQESQQAIRLRDEFLSIASHELKTPLTSLRLQLTLIERLLGEGVGARVRPKMETARRQVDRLASLVNMLLDVGRISTGRLSLDLAEMDLSHAVREALERLREVFAQAGCEVTLREGDPVVGRWDALRVDQVIVNLLTNAAKYGQGHPITVTVEGTPELARLIVRDEGIGIAAEDLPRLFGRFERAVSVRHYGGLGLGLFISKQIVEALGGRVRVDSRPGEGATFTVELPRRGPESSGA